MEMIKIKIIRKNKELIKKKIYVKYFDYTIKTSKFFYIFF